jgi:hypothetical protein
VIDVNAWQVTSVPKVGRLRRQEAAAPRIGDDAVRSRLYAEKPGGSSTTRHPSEDTACLYGLILDGSDNVRGAENQQERLWKHG